MLVRRADLHMVRTTTVLYLLLLLGFCTADQPLVWSPTSSVDSSGNVHVKPVPHSQTGLLPFSGYQTSLSLNGPPVAPPPAPVYNVMEPQQPAPVPAVPPIGPPLPAGPAPPYRELPPQSEHLIAQVLPPAPPIPQISAMYHYRQLLLRPPVAPSVHTVAQQGIAYGKVVSFPMSFSKIGAPKPALPLVPAPVPQGPAPVPAITAPVRTTGPVPAPMRPVPFYPTGPVPAPARPTPITIATAIPQTRLPEPQFVNAVVPAQPLPTQVRPMSSLPRPTAGFPEMPRVLLPLPVDHREVSRPAPSINRISTGVFLNNTHPRPRPTPALPRIRVPDSPVPQPVPRRPLLERPGTRPRPAVQLSGPVRPGLWNHFTTTTLPTITERIEVSGNAAETETRAITRNPTTRRPRTRRPNSAQKVVMLSRNKTQTVGQKSTVIPTTTLTSRATGTTQNPRFSIIPTSTRKPASRKTPRTTPTTLTTRTRITTKHQRLIKLHSFGPSKTEEPVSSNAPNFLARELEPQLLKWNEGNTVMDVSSKKQADSGTIPTSGYKSINDPMNYYMGPVGSVTDAQPDKDRNGGYRIDWERLQRLAEERVRELRDQNRMKLTERVVDAELRETEVNQHQPAVQVGNTAVATVKTDGPFNDNVLPSGARLR